MSKPSDPTNPKPGDLHIDASALTVIDLLPEQISKLSKLRDGYESALDDSFGEARVFYSTYVVVIAASVGLVLVPGAPLVPILFLTQAANAILLLPLLDLMIVLAHDRSLMGEYAADRCQTAVMVALAGVVALCTVALAVVAFQ